jgi:hypothetical protein
VFEDRMAFGRCLVGGEEGEGGLTSGCRWDLGRLTWWFRFG